MSTKRFSPSTQPQTLPDTARSPYAPGAVRSDHNEQISEYDRERRRLALTDPGLAADLARMPHDVAHQYAATARTPFEAQQREILADEGVDPDWTEESDFDNPRWSDDA